MANLGTSAVGGYQKLPSKDPFTTDYEKQVKRQLNPSFLPETHKFCKICFNDMSAVGKVAIPIKVIAAVAFGVIEFLGRFISHLANAWKIFINNNYNDLKNDQFKLALEGIVKGLDKELVSTGIRNHITTNYGSTFENILETFQERSTFRNELLNNTYEVLKILKEKITDKNAQQLHIKFVDALRKALKTKDYEKENPLRKDVKFCQHLLRLISYVQFTRVDINGHISKVCDSVKEKSKQHFEETGELSSQNISQSLLEDQKRVDAVPHNMKRSKLGFIKYKLSGWFSCNMDSLRNDGNVPYVRHKEDLSQFGIDAKSFICMRHGSPTSQTGVFNSIKAFFTMKRDDDIIMPEYRAFLKFAESKDEKILYVNHQRNKPSRIANESIRVKEITKLQEGHDNFHVLSTPFGNDELFNASGKFATMDVPEFKESLLDTIRGGGKYGVFLPTKLQNDDQFIEKMKGVIDKIHELYFENDKHIDFTKKQDFALLFFSYMKHHVMKELGITIDVNSCKSNIDRGNASTGIDEMLYLLFNGEEDNEEKLSTIREQTLYPSYSTRTTGMTTPKLTLLRSVFDLIAELSNGKKTAIKEYLFGIKETNKPG
jgi:hypothetical protein